MLKALDAADYDPEDFTDAQQDWLRKNEDVRENNGTWFFSGRLRRRIGEALFALLCPEDAQRSIFDQVRRERKDRDSTIDFEVQFDHDADRG